MLCPVCHTENDGDALQCSSCSSSLNFVPGSPSVPRKYSDSANSFNSPTPAPSPRWASSSSHAAIVSSGASAAASPAKTSTIQTTPDFGPRYRVEGKLGEGGMGSVYKAYDLELDRVVALKVIRTDLMANAEVLQRFKQELLLASRISHKNVLRIHDLGEGVGVKFISMAYVEGRNLAEILQDRKVLPVDEAVEIASQICQALAAAHAEGVVHRDLKPQNIMIDQGECVYVSDFGLAKSLEADALAATAMTAVGQVLGTPRYMSPEQVECGHIDGRTDIYSFGLILYEMVTGDLPFQGSSLQLMLGRVQSIPRNPSLLNSKLPPYLVGIIMRCLEKDPARRYQTFHEVLDDLESQRFTPTGKPLARRTPPWWSSKATVAVLASLLLACAVALFWSYLPGIGSRHTQVASSGLQITGRHLAVIPFRVVGDDPRLAEAAVGATEALNTRLFQAKGISVVSSSAAAGPGIKATDPPEKIGRNLGANLLLLGTVQGTGDSIRLDLSLWDSQKGITWTKEVPGMIQDLLTLEDEIYHDVVGALNVSPETATLAAHPTENTQAYDFYLRAQTTMRAQKDPQQVSSAIDLYNQAIKADPGFALAYAGLADANIAMYQKKKDSTWADRAVEAAKRAAELNPQLPEVHFSLGSAYSLIGRAAEAIDQIKQAIALLPNSDEGYRRLGGAYAAAGKSSDAIAALKKALDINPYYWMNYNRIGVAYTAAGDYENAVAAFRKVVEIDPENGIGYGNLGNALLFMGKFSDAVTPLQKALQISPTPARYSNLATTYYYLQQYDLAISLFEKAVQAAPASWMYVGNLGDAYRQSGKREVAAGIYDKAIELGKKDLVVNPRSATTMGGLGLWYARKGDIEQAHRLIQAARAIDSTNVDLMYFQAQIASVGKDNATALQALRDAFGKGLRPAFALAEPDLASLRSDPKFQKLVREFSRT